MKFNKKIVEKQVVQAAVAGVIKTLEVAEGQKYEAGDWIVTGLLGEQHPIKDGKFQKLYEPTEKPGVFRTKPAQVDAVMLRVPMVLSTSWGDMKGGPGDFLADNGDSQYVIAADAMAQGYEPA